MDYLEEADFGVFRDRETGRVVRALTAQEAVLCRDLMGGTPPQYLFALAPDGALLRAPDAPPTVIACMIQSQIAAAEAVCYGASLADTPPQAVAPPPTSAAEDETQPQPQPQPSPRGIRIGK